MTLNQIVALAGDTTFQGQAAANSNDKDPLRWPPTATAPASSQP